MARRFERQDQLVLEQRGPLKFEETVPSEGELRRFLTILFPLNDSEGEPTAICGIATDITDRKRVEEETIREYNRRLAKALEELSGVQQQIVRQERLNALGQMASGIAHDFNNALSPILGFTELLLSNPQVLADAAKTTRFLTSMHTAAQDAARIVRRLREFYRKREEKDEVGPVDAKRLVEEVVQLTEPKWKGQAQARGVQVRVATDLQDAPPIAGVEADLREALTNLVFNAVDAMPQGGALTLRARPSSPAGCVDIEVSDTGTGMTEEVRRRCLEPFYTTKGKEGTGMGLAMVYGIVRRHGGSIEIDTAVGKGSTFRLRMPVAAPRPSATVPSTAPAVGPRPLRVLVVDDEPLVREVVAGYLSLDGHVVEKAGNGKEAWERFRGDPFDLVITDAAMPEMTGQQLAAAVRGAKPHVPVILLSGLAEASRPTDGGGDGVSLVLSKPATLEALRGAIARVSVPLA